MVIKNKLQLVDLEQEKHFYDSEYREELVDNDVINTAEEGFMKGYEEAYD